MDELFNAGGYSAAWEIAQLPGGGQKKAVRIHRADSVHVIAVPSPGRVLLLREFRPFHGEYLWMIPSGKADKESGMEEAAQRELREETGFEAATLRHFSTVNLNDQLAFFHHIYVGTGLSKNPLPQDDDERIEVHELPIEEALEKVLVSPKTSVVSAYALLRYLRENPAA